MPISGYFDTPFASSGTKTAVPDAVQPDGSVSYAQGYGVDYTLDPATNPSALDIEQDKFNQLLYDITSAIQQYQQHSTAPFITSAMNGGSPYSYSKFDRVLHGGVLYQSLSNANTDTPPSANWAVSDVVVSNVYVGGTTTGSANVQAVATVSPASSSFTNGQAVICTAGFTNTNSMTFSAGGESPLTAKKDSGSGLVVLAPGDVTAGDTIIMTKNVAGTCWVLTAGFPLGSAAYKTASDNTKTNLASVSGSITAGHVPVFADTAGTLQDGGAPVFTKKFSTTGQTISSGGSLTLAHSLGATPFMISTSIVCASAEFGYSVGDELLVSLGGPFSGTSITPAGGALTFDATNVYVKWSSDTHAFNDMLNKSTGADASLTNANWTLSVRAVA